MQWFIDSSYLAVGFRAFGLIKRVIAPGTKQPQEGTYAARDVRSGKLPGRNKGALLARQVMALQLLPAYYRWPTDFPGSGAILSSSGLRIRLTVKNWLLITTPPSSTHRCPLLLTT